ncbi:SDR family oxidoreductase [Pantoea cypripedii]|uniref:Short-chain dehydrogenase/reductase n=1 Tax=Pantoea cypripedii TaxID=55209 RepID=A0A6B9G8S4_PANCY|nr:SDR family oxidoreductase [Pantoea cypripedii]QGY32922.1 short-chain dehydrogenase/reductase [Pantoea cypripedii]
MTKTWFVTGTSTGIGLQITERLLERKDRVVATLRRDGPLDDLKARYGDQLYIIKLDLTDINSIRTGVEEAFNVMGQVDTVIANAGYGLFGAAEELNDSQITRQIETNLTGQIQLIRAFLPRFRDQGRGRIVQISSAGGQATYPAFSVYHATKWGIEGFVESVAKEVATFGIDFIIVEPGPTRTNFSLSIDRAMPMACYEETPVGMFRQAAVTGNFAEYGNLGKTVDVMIAVMDSEKPPFRLVLGRGAYEDMRKALLDRLKVLEPQRDRASSVME